MATRAFLGLRMSEAPNVVLALRDEGVIFLPRKLDVIRHSPTGLEWGYAGSGPAQLALAILSDVCEDDEVAVRLHQRFKFDVVAHLPRAWFLLERTAVEEWLICQVAGISEGCMDLGTLEGFTP